MDVLDFIKQKFIQLGFIKMILQAFKIIDFQSFENSAELDNNKARKISSQHTRR